MSKSSLKQACLLLSLQIRPLQLRLLKHSLASFVQIEPPVGRCPHPTNIRRQTELRQRMDTDSVQRNETGTAINLRHTQEDTGRTCGVVHSI